MNRLKYLTILVTITVTTFGLNSPELAAATAEGWRSEAIFGALFSG
jgi:hypothetical protein